MKNRLPLVVAVGEILWDMFPDGPRFGGAPANLAHHAASMGADVVLVSSVGNDNLGDQALRLLKESSVDTQFIAVHHDRPTGQVTVTVDDQGHASYRFNADEAWDHIPWSPELADLAARADAVCFGTLSQRNPESRRIVRRFIESTRPDTLRVLDLNLRVPFYDDKVIQESLRLANVLKLNEDEFDFIAGHAIESSSELNEARILQQRFKLDLVAITRGARGSLLVRGDEVSDELGQTIEVCDTVGAGDAYTAALIIGLLRNISVSELNQTATRIAEFVCTQAGATPRIPGSLIDSLRTV